MPNNDGLRRCNCGQFLLVKEFTFVELVEETELPWPNFVADEELPDCIAQASSKQMEISARKAYWQALNHPYRERMRQQRETEYAAMKAQWELEHPDNRSWLAKKFGRPRAPYRRPENSPVTILPFTPTPEQEQNMQRMITLLTEDEQLATQNILMGQELVELYRETEQFAKAKALLQAIEGKNHEPYQQQQNDLINAQIRAPVPYK